MSLCDIQTNGKHDILDSFTIQNNIELFFNIIEKEGNKLGQRQSQTPFSLHFGLCCIRKPFGLKSRIQIFFAS